MPPHRKWRVVTAVNISYFYQNYCDAGKKVLHNIFVRVSCLCLCDLQAISRARSRGASGILGLLRNIHSWNAGYEATGIDTSTVVLFAEALSAGRSLMMSWCVPTVQRGRVATRGGGKRATAYAGMDLQPSAKDCIRLWHGGREGGRKHTGGGNQSGAKKSRHC